KVLAHRGSYDCWVYLLLYDLLYNIKRLEVTAVRCVLPCSFQSGSDVFIHWIKGTAKIRVHSFYHNKDQLGDQDQRFRNRTSLFKDQISVGNASLQVTGDEGRYKCHTSTIKGNQESFVNLKVDGMRKFCRSEGIYPEPQLSWSTSPPSNITFTNTTTVERTEQVLYNISSSLMLSAGVYDLLFICTIIFWKFPLQGKTFNEKISPSNLYLTINNKHIFFALILIVFFEMIINSRLLKIELSFAILFGLNLFMLLSISVKQCNGALLASQPFIFMQQMSHFY
uniref:Ig-like domain-containing protein n=1 Tax=Oreochromis aureus TaxID=47969 RepID=A0AAZ1X7Y5_OREAU